MYAITLTLSVNCISFHNNPVSEVTTGDNHPTGNIALDTVIRKTRLDTLHRHRTRFHEEGFNCTKNVPMSIKIIQFQ